MTIINTVTTAPDIKMGAREVKPTSFPTEVLPPEGYNALSKATIVAPDNLEPENIKKGVDIAGVVGTLDGGEGGGLRFNNDGRVVSPENIVPDMFESGMTTLAASAIRYWKIKTLVLPSTVTAIGDYSINGCDAMTSITIPESVTYIGGWSLASCSSLTSIVVPAGVTNVDWYAFAYCTSLTDLRMLPASPPIAGNSILANTPNVVITVPKGSLNAYKTATNWSQYADKMVEASE